MRSPRLSRSILGAAGIAWALAVGAGFFLLENEKATPGGIGEPPQRWPVESRLSRDPHRANLVIVAHPRCPCTRASLAELEQIVTHCRGLVTTHVLFSKPEQCSEDWERTDLWRTAAAIPGVRVFTDKGRAEALRFGAETSGHALLFDASGRLLFSGGITGSRGHQGDNPGRSTVIALLTRRQAEQERTAVFGCPLFDPRQRSQERAETCRSSP